MASYQQGDANAAGLLVDSLSPQFFRFFLGQVRNRALADDLLQDFWLRIHSARQTYRAGEPFAIRIVRPKIRLVRRGLALATYEERQRCAGAITRRRSSALFAPAATAPGGVAWLHLQETWIAP